jgi:hypothetical protein
VTQGRGRRRFGRRTVSSTATIEQYLRAGATPRFIERALQIEDAISRHRRRLARAYRLTRARHAGDPQGFERRWRAVAQRWAFADVNELIAEHNQWYPAERRLPMNPRTGDYVTAGGRDWRRRELDAAWILEQFPASF